MNHTVIDLNSFRVSRASEPFSPVAPFKATRPKKGLQPTMGLEEVGRLLNEFDDRHGSARLFPFAITVLGTMCRPIDAYHVVAEQIDAESGTITFGEPPAPHRRTLHRRNPLSSPVRPLSNAVRYLSEEQGATIVDLKEGASAAFRQLWREACERANLDKSVTPLSLKWAISSEVSARGASRDLVLRMLDHMERPAQLRRGRETHWRKLIPVVRVVDEVMGDLQRYVERRFLPA